MDLSEKQVLDKLFQGDTHAFEMIFKTYYSPLCRYAYSLLQDKEAAEEIVQSSLLVVWEKRQTISIDTSIKSYLFRMVRNACLNAIKHERVKQHHVAHELYVSSVAQESVLHQVQAAELENRIALAMQSLPEQCRLIFQLSRFEELKYQEIADQLNISVKTVENHMGKALKLMRERLKEYLPVFLLFLNDWIL